MKVCWFGVYDASYPRNDILLQGLQTQGVEIMHCNAQGESGWKKYYVLFRKLRSLRNDYDVIYCAFPANCVFLSFSIVMAKLFQQRPIVFDAFVSRYDTAILDRATASKYSLTALNCWLSDFLAAKLATHVIVDTSAQKDYWQQHCVREKMSIVPLGVNTALFNPQLIEREASAKSILVQYHGSYIPMQGLPYVVEAIALLQNETNLRFRFVGSGQLFPAIKDKIDKAGLDIELIPRVPIQEMPRYLSEADIVLGIFGDSDKANRVVPNKLYEGIALRKPVITKDTLVMREHFDDTEVAYVINTGEAIADKIKELANDVALRNKIAVAGYQKVQQTYSPKPIGKKLKIVLEKVTSA